ncbi:MAG: hypothetical protein Q7U75_14675 [Desulfobacterales bacterium]|nr:hypothetical protein [Desulfobacterales bacterium]
MVGILTTVEGGVMLVVLYKGRDFFGTGQVDDRPVPTGFIKEAHPGLYSHTTYFFL